MSSSKIRPAEKPLAMFVSSVMDDDLQPYRDTAESLINSRFLTSWVFEYTPASSESLDESYLRHVRNADFVIWIGGEKTSNPVKREVNEAIIHQKRLLVFLLPANTRNAGTEEIIETISSNKGPKWCKLDDRNIETFEEALDYTIQDEFARAIRNDHSWQRIGTLERLNRDSRARSLSRFMASGLSRNQANRMFKKVSDLPVLASPELPKEGEVSLLVGTLGSGKSFTAEKVYQEVLDQSRSPLAPVPFYITARHVRNGLDSYIKQLNPELGDVTSIGASIVIDQIDDLPNSDSRRLYEEALALTLSWPKTRVLLVSRPQPWSRDCVATTHVREMSLEEVETVVELVSDSIRSQLLWIMPHALRRSVQRPLFAILLAKYLESNEDQVPISMAKLLDRMVREAVENAGTESNQSIEKMLRSLAVKLTDGHADVKLTDLTIPISDRNRLLNTHLVYEESERLDFALPILRQWFAFDAICQKEVDIVELSLDAGRLDKWEDVLTTAVELATNQIDDIVEPIVVNNPSVASVILDSAFGHLWYSSPDSDLSADTFGKHIRRAMTAFAKGIGPLSGLIAPVNEQGEVKPLGVAKLNEGYYKTSWYEGSSDIENVVGVSSEDDLAISDWPHIFSRTRIDSPAWAWLDVKHQLRERLEKLLNCYGFPIRNTFFLHESAWELASSALNRHSQLEPQVSSDEMNDVLRWIQKRPSTMLRQFSPETVVLAATYLQGLIDKNRPLRAPWPGPDQALSSSKWVWELYSPERLRKRLQRVLSASLEMYQEIVSKWFITMSNRFELFSLNPVRLVGYLYVPEGKTSDLRSEPSVTFYFEPIRGHVSSSVDIFLGSIPLAELESTVLKVNPNAITICTSMVVSIFGRRPATDQAYDWLKDGLRSAKWD